MLPDKGDNWERRDTAQRLLHEGYVCVRACAQDRTAACRVQRTDMCFLAMLAVRRDLSCASHPQPHHTSPDPARRLWPVASGLVLDGAGARGAMAGFTPCELILPRVPDDYELYRGILWRLLFSFAFASLPGPPYLCFERPAKIPFF